MQYVQAHLQLLHSLKYSSYNWIKYSYCCAAMQHKQLSTEEAWCTMRGRASSSFFLHCPFTQHEDAVRKRGHTWPTAASTAWSGRTARSQRKTADLHSTSIQKSAGMRLYMQAWSNQVKPAALAAWMSGLLLLGAVCKAL